MANHLPVVSMRCDIFLSLSACAHSHFFFRGLHVPAVSSSLPRQEDEGASGGLYSTGGGMSSASSMT